MFLADFLEGTEIGILQAPMRGRDEMLGGWCGAKKVEAAMAAVAGVGIRSGDEIEIWFQQRRGFALFLFFDWCGLIPSVLG